ncbi:phosphatidate cytidylyltransferase [Bacillus sp. 2205SS5-2]|uniref:phosphatidate cytidylyltransferase n=1 Tax=Bacillus sp. 2205SS5-2 TaxID=3109031 RepID=UPI0030041E80
MVQTYVTLSMMAFALAIVHLSFYVVKSFKKREDFSALNARVKTWWGMLVVFSIATLFNSTIALISLLFLCFFSLKEYFSMMKTRKAERQLFWWAYLAIPLQFYWISIGWYGMFIVFIPVYVFLFLPLPRILGNGTAGFLRSVSSTQWGLMLMVFGLSHLAYYQVANEQYGANLVLFLVVLTQANDVVQFLVSIFIGEKKVVPSAHPNITWEGFTLSILTTTALSTLLYPYLTPLDMKFGILSGVIISVSAFLGSLTISVLKRDLLIGDQEKFLQLKESYLTSVDSLTYTAPIFFHVIRYYFDFM